MGFAEKIKNLFTDEEEVIETREIEVEEKEEHKLPTFMRKKIEKEEEQKSIIEDKKEEVISDRELVKTNNKFSFPVAFDEEEFIPTNKANTQNILIQEKEKAKTVAEIYAKKEADLPARFRPTPIISPVYGILDKNYSKEDVLEKEENDYEIPRPSKKIDFETVRKKAFGSLSDEIKDNMLCQNCELLKEAKEQEKNEKDNLLYNMLNEKEDISLETAEENYYDFGVAYEMPKEDKNEEQIKEINIDEINIEVSQEIKIINHNDEEATGEKIEVKDIENEPDEIAIKDSYEEELEEEIDAKEETEEIPLTRSENKKKKGLEELELTDDLYNLIDSMYEERND